SRARAEAVVALCAEFIQSYGRTEWVKSLVGLARLRQRYADLEVPIELVAVPAAPERTPAARGADGCRCPPAFVVPRGRLTSLRRCHPTMTIALQEPVRAMRTRILF